MKMKKFFATLLIVAMALFAITGCSKKSAKNGVKTGNGITQTMTISYNGENGSADGTIVLKGAGKTSSFSANLSGNVEGQKVDLKGDNLIVVANDKLYLNVKPVLDAVKQYGSVAGDEASAAISAIGNVVTEDYLYIDLSGVSEALQSVNTDFAVKNMEDLKKELEGISAGSSIDDIQIDVDNAQDAAKLVNALKDAIKNNKAEYIDLMYKSCSSVDIKKITESMVDSIVDSMAEMYGAMGVSKDMIKSMIEEQMDFEEVQMSKSDVEDAVDGMIEELDDLVSELEDMGDEDFPVDIKISLVTTDNGYETTVSASDENNNVNIKIVTDTASSVNVVAPKNAQNVMDIVSSFASLLQGMF